MDAFIKFIGDIDSKVWWAFLGGGISLTAYLVLEKFKNRISYFESTISFNSLGTSLDDNLFGNIKVSHNSREIKHLNLISINIKNASNTDFEKLRVICWVDNRSQILAWKGNFDDTLIAVKYDELHAARENELNEKLLEFFEEHGTSDLPRDLDADFYYISRNKEVLLPVFNRGSSVTLNFLVENFDGNVPTIQCPVQHKSVMVIPAVSREAKNDRLGRGMIVCGYIILFFAIFWLFTRESIQNENLILFSIISVLWLWLGLLAFQIKNYLMSIFR